MLEYKQAIKIHNNSVDSIAKSHTVFTLALLAIVGTAGSGFVCVCVCVLAYTRCSYSIKTLGKEMMRYTLVFSLHEGKCQPYTYHLKLCSVDIPSLIYQERNFSQSHPMCRVVQGLDA